MVWVEHLPALLLVVFGWVMERRSRDASLGLAALYPRSAGDSGSRPKADSVAAPAELGAHVHTNRLIFSKSPYLLQHAHNPVDWYEWGEEAFEKARRDNKPIFLSVGYSTCHWCHVMERESFENPDIAAIMNEHRPI